MIRSIVCIKKLENICSFFAAEINCIKGEKYNLPTHTVFPDRADIKSEFWKLLKFHFAAYAVETKMKYCFLYFYATSVFAEKFRTNRIPHFEQEK